MNVLSVLALCATLFFAITYASPIEDEEVNSEENIFGLENQSKLPQSVAMEDKAVDQAFKGKTSIGIRSRPLVSPSCRLCCVRNLDTKMCRLWCRYCLG